MFVHITSKDFEEGTFWELLEGEVPVLKINSPESSHGQTKRQKRC